MLEEQGQERAQQRPKTQEQEHMTVAVVSHGVYHKRSIRIIQPDN